MQNIENAGIFSLLDLCDIKVWIILTAFKQYFSSWHCSYSFPCNDFILLLQVLGDKILNTVAFLPEFLRMVILGDIFISQLQLVLVVKVHTTGAHRNTLGLIRVVEEFVG